MVVLGGGAVSYERGTPVPEAVQICVDNHHPTPVYCVHYTLCIYNTLFAFLGVSCVLRERYIEAKIANAPVQGYPALKKECPSSRAFVGP